MAITAHTSSMIRIENSHPVNDCAKESKEALMDEFPVLFSDKRQVGANQTFAEHEFK